MTSGLRTRRAAVDRSSPRPCGIKTPRQIRRFLFEELEPRCLLSVAPQGVAADPHFLPPLVALANEPPPTPPGNGEAANQSAPPPPALTENAKPALPQPSASTQPAPPVPALDRSILDPNDGQTQPPTAAPPPQELVVVDTQVEGYQTLVEDLLSRQDDSRQMELVLLDASRDGIEQMSEILGQHNNISALHLISHGSDGSIDIGNSQLNFQSLVQNQDAIRAWGKAFTADGDFLIYGCNVAETQFGRSFVDYFSSLTGTDVSASSDDTGSTALGGDWTLEYRNGSIEAKTALSSVGQKQWANVLAITSNGTVTSAQSANVESTGNQLTWSHTVNSGSNRVLFVELAIDGLGATVSGVTYNGVALTQVGRTAGNHAVEIWRLINPPAGTYNVVANFTDSTAVAGGATTFNGVNQSTPTGSYASGSGTGMTATATVTSATGELVIDAQYWKVTSANIAPSGSGQSS